jgi:hypothetical protein
LARLVRRRAVDDGGQVLALAAVAIAAVVAMAGFVVDVGAAYRVHRSAQAAADAAATAGADDLPGNPTQAIADATTYANKNISGATVTVTTPYNGQADEIQVQVSVTQPTVFAKVVGINSLSATASAVAKHVSGGSKYAIFTRNTSCSSSLTWTAGGVTINGGVRSNGAMKVSGGGNTFGPTAYGGPNNCGWSDSAGSNTYGGSSSPTSDSSNYPWPEPWPTSASEIASYGITCTDNAATFTWLGSPGPQSGHTYCATTSISIKGSGYTCTCTFIAPTVSITGSSETLSPNYQDLLIDAYGTSTWKLSGGSDHITGTVFVPNAQFNVSGTANDLYNVFSRRRQLGHERQRLEPHGDRPVDRRAFGLPARPVDAAGAAPGRSSPC